MKLLKKNIGPLLFILAIMLIIGTVTWEILVRLLSYGDIHIDVHVGPIGFDISVISFYIHINPGSLLGIAGGFFLFRRL